MDKKNNIVIISGTNIDRVLLGNLKEFIEHDSDINQLINQGSRIVMWERIIFKLSFFVFIGSLLGMTINICAIIYNFKEHLSFLQNFQTHFTFGSIISFSAMLASFLSTIITPIKITTQLKKKKTKTKVSNSTPYGVNTLKDNYNKFKYFLKNFKDVFENIKLKKDRLTPNEIWQVHQGSNVDAQIALCTSRLPNTHVSLIYGGIPYYDTIPISSIEIEWVIPPEMNISHKKILNHYRKIYKNFAKQTVNAIIKKQYFALNDLEISNCVFGTLFLSSYFDKFAQEFLELDEEKKNYLFGEKKIYVDCENLQVVKSKDGQETSEQGNELEKHLAKTLIQYATTPDFFTFSPKNNLASASLKIRKIYLLDRTITKNIKNRAEKKIKKENRNNKKNVLRIPIKKIMIAPYGKLTDDLLPEVLDRKKFNTILSLGGAEQNLVLPYLINKHFWLIDTQTNNAENPRFGIAENHFCKKDKYTFLAGTESYVYGKTKNLNQRKSEETENGKNVAEVCCFSTGHFDLNIVYGYNAISTKISTMKFLEFLYLNEIRTTRFIPDVDTGTMKVSYNLEFNGTWEELKGFWDKYDIINQSVDNVLLLLKKISVKENQ